MGGRRDRSHGSLGTARAHLVGCSLGACVALQAALDYPARVASLDLVADRLGEIRVPTCVIVGGQDILTPVSRSEQRAKRIAGAKLHVVPGCGHITFTERPAETADSIRTFLGRVVASRAFRGCARPLKPDHCTGG